MVQEIITYIIVAAAFLLALNQFRKMIIKLSQKKKVPSQSKCSGCTADCALRDLSLSKNCTTPQKTANTTIL